MKLDLLEAKRWAPKAEMGRFYFGENYVQVNISGNNAYYKIVGFEEEIENEDEIRSQLSYFTRVEVRRIYKSKF